MTSQRRYGFMIRTLGLLGIAAAVWAQPAFEAASVRPALPGKLDEGQRQIQFAPGNLTIRATPLKTLIMIAYGVRPYQVSVPAWAEQERYDVVAKAAGPAGENELRQMLQRLLADRFQLALHR